MSKKQIIKMCIDLAMTIALPILMCYSLVGETAHEIIGTAMFGCFIAHHILNIGWFKALFKGRYTLRRSVNTAVNLLIFLCMLGLMYSGIVLSRHVFTFVQLGGAMTARTIHKLCAYWGLVLMSVHLGMHIRQMTTKMKLKGKKLRLVLQIIFGIIAIMGIYSFIKLSYADYLFVKVEFVFIDTSVSAFITALRHLSVMILFAEVGYWLNHVLSRTPKTNSSKEDV